MIIVRRINTVDEDKKDFMIRVRYDFHVREISIKYTSELHNRLFIDVTTQYHYQDGDNKKEIETKLIEELKIQVRENFELQKESLKSMHLNINEIDNSIKEFESFNPKHLDRENKLKRILEDDDYEI